MSADNWDICPRCKVRIDANKAKQKQRAEDAYGKLPIAEFDELRRIAEEEIDYGRPLREDYELGILTHVEGETKFYVDYRGRCSAEGCGFEHIFKHEAMLSP